MFNMSYFIANFAKKKDSTEKKKPSELKRWGKAIGVGALGMTGLTTLGMKGKKRKAIRQIINTVNNADPYTRFYDRKTRKQLYKAGMNTIIPASVVVGGLYGAGGYGAYRGGKSIVNKLRGNNEDK